jgi:hypothetical protein
MRHKVPGGCWLPPISLPFFERLPLRLRTIRWIKDRQYRHGTLQHFLEKLGKVAQEVRRTAPSESTRLAGSIKARHYSIVGSENRAVDIGHDPAECFPSENAQT